jgi:hypothetical protein
MNKWFRRAAGTVGVAGGILLLGAGSAHADSALTPGSLDDVSPTGASNLGMTVDTPGSQITTPSDQGPVALQRNDGQVGATLHTPGENGQRRDVFATGRLPDVVGNLPLGVSQSQLLPGTGASGLPTERASAGLVPNVRRSVPLAASRAVPAFQQAAPEALPVVGNTPLAGGNLPVLTGQGLPGLPGVDNMPLRGNVKPVNDMAVPLGATESAPALDAAPGGLPVPLFGTALQGNQLPLVGDPLEAYQPRHASQEAAGSIGGFPNVTGLPVIGNLLAGGAGLLG